MKLLKKRIIPVVLSVLMALSMYASVPLAASADTDAASPVAITALSDITNMAGNYIISDNVSGITIDAATWTPIGTATSPFTGTFDGNGKTITWSGSAAMSADNFAIFGKSSGTIENFDVAGSYSVDGTNLRNISAVVGYNTGTISGVDSTTNISTGSGLCVIGGIVGQNAGTVKDCTNAGDITSDYTGKNGVGGMVGRNGNNNTATETGKVENCANSGDISCSNGRWVGGIAGFQNSLSSVTNCTNTGTITAYRDSGSLVGKEEGTTSDSTGVDGAYTITVGGNYTIENDAVVTVSTSDAVVLKGSTTTSYKVTVNCTQAANLTISNLNVSAPASSTSNIINFTTGSNTLTISGENLLENSGTSLNNAVVHVPSGVSLNVKGDGVLYLYKSSLGTGIGSDANEASGAITFNHTGSIYLKTTKTGAGIGGDTAVGNITINSGNMNLITVSKAAAIGGSASCIGGNVYMNGGNVKITCDFKGHAIGSGANKTDGGTLTITGGSLYVEKTTNSSLTDANIINATITNGTTTSIARLTLPVSGTFSAGAFTVTVGETQVYNGKVNFTSYVDDATTTKANWDQSGASEVYLYIPITSSSLMITNEDEENEAYTITYSTDTGLTATAVSE